MGHKPFTINQGAAFDRSWSLAGSGISADDVTAGAVAYVRIGNTLGETSLELNSDDSEVSISAESVDATISAASTAALNTTDNLLEVHVEVPGVEVRLIERETVRVKPMLPESLAPAPDLSSYLTNVENVVRYLPLADAVVDPPVSGESVYYSTETGGLVKLDSLGAKTPWGSGGGGLPVFLPEDYGATGDGIADDTTAIQDAIDATEAAGGGIVQFDSKTYLISAITVPQQVTLRGTGFGNTSTTLDGTVLKKIPSANAAVTTTGTAASLQSIIVLGQAGDSGDGVHLIHGTTTLLRDVLVAKMGNDGVRVGKDSAVGLGNLNNWQMFNVTASECGRDGFHFHDKPGNPADANAGSGVGLHGRQNGRHGIYVGNAWLNSFVGLHTEGNSGHGVHCDDESQWNDFLGGDSEANTLGDYYTHPDSRQNRFLIGQTNERTNFQDGDTTPSVSARRFWGCVNSGATTITYFDDYTTGQEIEVRLDVNTTIKHDPALIRLTGQEDLTGDSNTYLRLQNISGLWVQTGLQQLRNRPRVWVPTQINELSSWAKGDDIDASITGGKYDDITERGAYKQVSNNSFVQIGGSEPDAETRHGKLTPVYTGAQALYSAHDLEYYESLHDPEGVCAGACRFRVDGAVSNHYVLGTAIRNNTNLGFGIYINAGTLELWVSNGLGGGGAPVDIITGPAIASATDYTVAWTKNRDQVSLYVDGVYQGSMTLTTPQRGAPLTAMVIGNRSGGTGPLGGPLYEFLFWTGRTLTNIDLQIVQNYLDARWS